MLRDLLSAYARDPASAWVCGGFGALAEFTFDKEEPITFADDDAAIGAATAKAFAAAGAEVALMDIDLDAAEKAAKSIGKTAIAVPCDVTNDTVKIGLVAAIPAVAHIGQQCLEQFADLPGVAVEQAAQRLALEVVRKR